MAVTDSMAPPLHATRLRRACDRSKPSQGGNCDFPTTELDAVRCALTATQLLAISGGAVGQRLDLQERPRLPLPSCVDGPDILLLRVSEMVRLRGADPHPLHQQRPAHLVDGSRVRHPRGQLVPGGFGMGVWRPHVPGILEQATGSPRGSRLVLLVHSDRDHHPVHAGRLGASAGGFPAMTGNVPFLMKDVVLLAVSFYLLKQDLVRAVHESSDQNVPVSRAS